MIINWIYNMQTPNHTKQIQWAATRHTFATCYTSTTKFAFHVKQTVQTKTQNNEKQQPTFLKGETNRQGFASIAVSLL